MRALRLRGPRPGTCGFVIADKVTSEDEPTVTVACHVGQFLTNVVDRRLVGATRGIPGPLISGSGESVVPDHRVRDGSKNAKWRHFCGCVQQGRRVPGQGDGLPGASGRACLLPESGVLGLRRAVALLRMPSDVWSGLKGQNT